MLRRGDSSKQQEELSKTILLMARDISLYTGLSEDDIMEEYYTTANPNMFMQVTLPEDDYPITSMLGKMVREEQSHKKLSWNDIFKGGNNNGKI